MLRQAWLEQPHSDSGEEDQGLHISIQPDAARADFLKKHTVRANKARTALTDFGRLP